VVVKEVKVKVLRPTEENFERFGTFIKAPGCAPSVSMPKVLDYWDQVVNLFDDGCDAQLGFLTAKFRPFEFTRMERHIRSDEAFIPLEGKACIFALAPACDQDSPTQLPDPSEVVAFILDGSTAVNLRAGVWHWAPFPLAESANFVLALRKGTTEEDIDLRDLEKDLQVVFKLDL